METYNRNTWLGSFVKITSENTKKADDPYYIVYRQQNGWCTLHQLTGGDDVKVVKMSELKRVRVMHICVPIAEVDRILKALKKGKDAWLAHSGDSSVWNKAFEISKTTLNGDNIVHIINNKYPENLYFNCRNFFALSIEDKPTQYGVILTKLLYKSEKIIRN